MAEEVDKSRRGFLKAMIGLSAVAAVGGLGKGVVQNLITPAVGLTNFPETLLYWVDPNDPTAGPQPLKTRKFPELSPSVWIYYYPLSDEPNFLIKFNTDIEPVTVLIDATGTTFQSPGGVGPSVTAGDTYGPIVSFSAICQHLGCVPPIIRYYPPDQIKTLPPSVQSVLTSEEKNLGVIHCDCHGSTYDPSKGAAIITHPTYRPLPNVILEYNPLTDTLFAKKLIGPTVFGHPSDLTGGNPISNLKKTLVQTISSG
ncbi:Rieske 2Fe-2S domain-containing protein [Caldiplasma sukawensis]